MFRLHSRIVLWNFLIIGLITVSFGLFLSYSLRDYIENQLRDQLVQESALAAAYVAKADPLTPSQDLARTLGDLLQLRVTLIAPDGHVAGDSDLNIDELGNAENLRGRPEVQDAIASGIGTAIEPSGTPPADTMFVVHRGEPFIVRLAKPLSDSNALIADLRSRLFLAMLIAVSVTVGFGFIARGLISRPLRQMSVISTRLASGDLGQRLPISGDEEIASLGNALNTMAQNLSKQMGELSEGKLRLELMVGAMSEGVMVLDSNGQITLTNRAVRKMLETDRDLIGRTPLELFRRPELENSVRSVLGGGPPEVVEMITWNARTFQANVAPVANASGVVDSVVVVFHDLTEIRRTERMRRDFVANVSHEFKTPLTSIRGYAETLLAGALQEKKTAVEFVRIIERNAQHLETLVSDLLMLARLEAELPASMEEVDVKAMIDEHVSSRQAVLSERGIQMINDCPHIEIQTDRLRLSTAVSNLIDNAIHYNKPNGEVRITGSLEGGTFQLVIADTGQGIPAEELPRIFERFYRVDKARSRESGGTGLGLSIVKHAIESQGGSIQVSSRIGLGSTFTIRLPQV